MEVRFKLWSHILNGSMTRYMLRPYLGVILSTLITVWIWTDNFVLNLKDTKAYQRNRYPSLLGSSAKTVLFFMKHPANFRVG